jgi:uncharacterized protein (DUF58 family)
VISSDLIRKIRRIEIVTSRLADEQFAGQYHSVFRGRGMAFEEVRPYQPGDDVRAIDWNVSARMNEPYVKLFVEEREMTVLLLVDMSRSGLFGTRAQAKRELAAEVAAVLAFSAIRNDDRVGLVAFTDRVERYVPPKKGRKHVLAVISEILTHRAQGRGTDLGAALDFLGHVARRRSVAFVLSDFLATGYQRALRVVSRKHDIVPLVVGDPVEDDLPDVGLVTFEDLETGRVRVLDTSSRARLRYAERTREARAARESLCRRLSLETIDVRTDRPYLPALVQFFRARERRLHHG